MLVVDVNDTVLDTNLGIATIGNFDGIHLGHQEILKLLSYYNSDNNYCRYLITFEPNTQEYFLKNESQTRLSLLRDKYYILKKNNLVDKLVVLNFNKHIANMTADEFIGYYLIKNLNIKIICQGRDFQFGRDKLGNLATFKKHSIAVMVVDDFYLDHKKISSSLIRNYASKNQLDIVKKYLNHNIHYTSRVIRGNRIGTKYGVPTINLSIGSVKPSLWGIYIAFVYIDNIRYNAVASIGKNPTVKDGNQYQVEAHILDVNMDLYGKIATIEIIKFIRDEIKFISLEELFKQIYKDIDIARSYFNCAKI